MKYIIDTNVVKRLGGGNPNKNVQAWLSTISASDLYISAFTLQEISKGVEAYKKSSKADPKTTASLESALNVLRQNFQGKILPLGEDAAVDWGRRLAKHGTKNGNDLAIISIVATNPPATAVTQNIQDFRHRGIDLLNPFDAPPSCFSDPEK